VAEILDPAPPQWITFHDDAGRPLASIRSRAWHEWQLRREGRTLNAEQREAVIARDGYVCGLCGGVVEPTDVHIDHIWPRSLGGSNALDNLQVAHASCNLSKGNRV
jgi:5-methylcytosine-specific restriction endonuclease McrA